MIEEFCPSQSELAMIASLVYPTVRNPKKAVEIAEQIARAAHERALAIWVDLKKKERGG